MVKLANATLPNILLDGKDIISVLRNPASAVSPHKFIWHYCGKNVTAGAILLSLLITGVSA